MITTSGSFNKTWRTSVVGYAFVLPAIVVLGVFVLYPLVKVVQYSFYHWDLMSGQRWVGLKNYSALAHDGAFVKALVHTVIYSVLSLLFIYFASLFGAVLMNKPLRGRGIFRAGYFLPSLIPAVAVGLAWQGIFDPADGLLNTILRAVGLQALAAQWLANPHTALYCVIFVNIWQWWGYNMMLFLAGMQTIPQEVLDAAKVDGASPFVTFWRVEWPLLRPVSIVVILTTIIGSFKAFDLIYVMTGGGPFDSSTVLVLQMYRYAFQFLNFGYASAMAVVLLVIVLLWSAVQLRLSRIDTE